MRKQNKVLLSDDELARKKKHKKIAVISAISATALVTAVGLGVGLGLKHKTTNIVNHIQAPQNEPTLSPQELPTIVASTTAPTDNNLMTAISGNAQYASISLTTTAHLSLGNNDKNKAWNNWGVEYTFSWYASSTASPAVVNPANLSAWTLLNSKQVSVKNAGKNNWTGTNTLQVNATLLQNTLGTVQTLTQGEKINIICVISGTFMSNYQLTHVVATGGTTIDFSYYWLKTPSTVSLTDNNFTIKNAITATTNNANDNTMLPETVFIGSNSSEYTMHTQWYTMAPRLVADTQNQIKNKPTTQQSAYMTPQTFENTNNNGTVTVDFWKIIGATNSQYQVTESDFYGYSRPYYLFYATYSFTNTTDTLLTTYNTPYFAVSSNGSALPTISNTTPVGATTYDMQNYLKGNVPLQVDLAQQNTNSAVTLNYVWYSTATYFKDLYTQNLSALKANTLAIWKTQYATEFDNWTLVDFNNWFPTPTTINGLTYYPMIENYNNKYLFVGWNKDYNTTAQRQLGTNSIVYSPNWFTWADQQDNATANVICLVTGMYHNYLLPNNNQTHYTNSNLITLLTNTQTTPFSVTFSPFYYLPTNTNNTPVDVNYNISLQSNWKTSLENYIVEGETEPNNWYSLLTNTSADTEALSLNMGATTKYFSLSTNWYATTSNMNNLISTTKPIKVNNTTVEEIDSVTQTSNTIGIGPQFAGIKNGEYNYQIPNWYNLFYANGYYTFFPQLVISRVSLDNQSLNNEYTWIKNNNTAASFEIDVSNLQTPPVYTTSNATNDNSFTYNNNETMLSQDKSLLIGTPLSTQYKDNPNTLFKTSDKITVGLNNSYTFLWKNTNVAISYSYYGYLTNITDYSSGFTFYYSTNDKAKKATDLSIDNYTVSGTNSFNTATATITDFLTQYIITNNWSTLLGVIVALNVTNAITTYNQYVVNNQMLNSLPSNNKTPTAVALTNDLLVFNTFNKNTSDFISLNTGYIPTAYTQSVLGLVSGWNYVNQELQTSLKTATSVSLPLNFFSFDNQIITPTVTWYDKVDNEPALYWSQFPAVKHKIITQTPREGGYNYTNVVSYTNGQPYQLKQYQLPYSVYYYQYDGNYNFDKVFQGKVTTNINTALTTPDFNVQDEYLDNVESAFNALIPNQSGINSNVWYTIQPWQLQSYNNLETLLNYNSIPYITWFWLLNLASNGWVFPNTTSTSNLAWNLGVGYFQGSWNFTIGINSQQISGNSTTIGLYQFWSDGDKEDYMYFWHWWNYIACQFTTTSMLLNTLFETTNIITNNQTLQNMADNNGYLGWYFYTNANSLSALQNQTSITLSYYGYPYAPPNGGRVQGNDFLTYSYNENGMLGFKIYPAMYSAIKTWVLLSGISGGYYGNMATGYQQITGGTTDWVN